MYAFRGEHLFSDDYGGRQLLMCRGAVRSEFGAVDDSTRCALQFGITTIQHRLVPFTLLDKILCKISDLKSSSHSRNKHLTIS